MKLHLPPILAACRSAMPAPPSPEEEEDWASLFGEDDSSYQDNLAGNSTSTIIETGAEIELTAQLDNTAAAAPTTEPLQLILAPAEQEDNLEALLNCLPVQALLAEQVEAAEKERPAKRGRGRPKGKKPKEAPITYRCRYGCLKHMVGGHALRKHMMRVHGIFSSQNGKVLVHHCGRRYSPNWAGLTCNSPKSMCKDLVEGTAEWERHHVQPPSTQQEAADTFAYNDKNGLAPSALVVVGSSEEQFTAAVAAAATPAQVNNGPLAAGSSQDQAIAIVDDEEEDEQLPAAKMRRV